MKTYNTTDVKLILEWVDRYFEVSALINNVFGDNNFKNPPPVPSVENEIEYQRLRYRFRKNHDKFVPIWADFCLSNGISMDFNGDIEGMEYRENQFLYYYPDNLFELAYSIGATSTIDNWDLDKQTTELFLYVNNCFAYTVLHLKHWIGEFANIVEGE